MARAHSQLSLNDESKDLSTLRFAPITLGCKVNRVESDSLTASLMARGARLSELDAADLIIVNSCTVTDQADKKTRKALRSALKANKGARVIMTGCAVAIDKSAWQAIDGRIETLTRQELAEEFGFLPSILREGLDFRTRVGIKVQDGCDRACSYCIVHIARGPARSEPFCEIVDQAEKYFSHGTKELVLTGIDLGSYNWQGKSLTNLIEALLEKADRYATDGKPPARIRASSLEPTSLDEDFIGLFAQSHGRLCRHIHLPLQSGSSRVLREMARPYTAEAFASLVDELYRRIPSLSLTTDIICGFPGETDDDFQESLALAQHCRFSKIHVFPYSMRKNTPAAERKDQIAVEIKAKRASELRSLSDQLREQDRQRRRGTTELVLVEQKSAITESYHEVALPKNAQTGDLVAVRL